MQPSCQTPLRTWMDQTGVTVLAVARAVGMQTSYITNVANGRAFPGLVCALKIETATAGKVPVRAWLETTEGKLRWEYRDPQAPKKRKR